MYERKGQRSALDLDSNELLRVLGLDAHGAHSIIVHVFRDERLHGGGVHVGNAAMP